MRNLAILSTAFLILVFPFLLSILQGHFIIPLIIEHYAETKYNQGYQEGRQSILDSLHTKTEIMIQKTDSMLFPDNPAYEYAVEEMLRRKGK